MPRVRIARTPVARGAVALAASATLALTAAIGGSTGTAAVAAIPTVPSHAYGAGDYAHGQAVSVLPPGENGSFTLAGGEHPANSQDQLAKYNALLYGYGSLTDSKLSKYYDDESFGVKGNPTAETPSDPTFPSGQVQIYRDANDMPHIYGATKQAAAFGAGYAQAQDRLFLMDVLRHYGAGTLSAFIGPSCADEQMDHDELLLAPYTPAQAQAQVDALPSEYGSQGALAKGMIDAYVDGVNAWISHTTTDPADLDLNYAAAANNVPQTWTAGDVVDIAGLIGGIFGKGGGTEVANSALYKYLKGKLGAAKGAKAFREFKDQNDPAAPTTVVDKKFPYETPKHINHSLTAIPDHPRKALKGGPTDTTSGCNGVSSNPTALAAIASLHTLPKHMSNALVVNANQTKARHPIAVFGPQVSYFAPEILSEEEINAPGYHAEGATFPGTGIVELGRGVDYAWSATSAGSDLIDQRLEKICDPAGKKPTATEKYYDYKGKCLAMKHLIFTENATTKPGGTGAPVSITHNVYLTRHGVVQGWTTAQHGKPVAVVNQRSTYNHDIDSVVGFLRWGEPSLTHDVHSWYKGAEKISYTFNWLYVDSRHTAYYVSGKDPVRTSTADPNLPTWGTGKAEWHGYLSAGKHVHESDPKQGFFVSWNNKPAPGFSAADDQYGYGATYRSQMLVSNLERQLRLHHHKVNRAEVVEAMENAATQDLDGLTVLPQLIHYTKGHHEPKGVATMLRTLRHWHSAGSHRRKHHAANSQYQYHSAVAIMDELEPRLIESVYNHLLEGGGGIGGAGSTGGATTPGYSILPMQFVNTPNSGDAHLGSAYDGGWEGYMQTTLAQLRGKHPADAFTPVVTDKWCTSGPSSCRKAINKALLATYDALKKANGTSTVSSWTKSTALVADEKAVNQPNETMPQFDAIRFRPLGAVSQPDIDWQNRPTFQQVIQFPSHRASP
jgi:acyl-homoserine lactone acylase PvdQ